MQAVVPDELQGRIFGVKDALSAWAFGVAFLAGGALVSLLGSRAILAGAGLGAFAVASATSATLRHEPGDRAGRADHGRGGFRA